MEELHYRVIRSNRRSIALQLREDGLLVRAPQRMTDAEIARFVSEHRDWIQKHAEQLAEESANQLQVERLSMEEIQALADQALQVIPERVRYFAPQIGVTYGRITIRNQRSRWGSCSAKGNLNFNCLLMLAPPEVVDAVVVHELCHRKVMNHSQAFYAEVHRVYPDYDRWAQWLKENGGILLRRMTG